MEMNANPTPTPNPTHSNLTALPLGNGQKPGERLRQVRMSQKRDLAEVSAALNIPERHLVALEADDYAHLPEPPFIRGYLRSYARLLGVDANALVARFGEIYQQDTGQPVDHRLNNSPLKPMGRLRPRDRRHRGLWLRLALGALVLLLLSGLVYQGMHWWLNRPVTAEAAPVADTAVPVETLPATVPIAAPAPAATAADVLVLVLSQPAEVQVKDASSKVLLQGTQQPGAPLRAEGVSPFEISLPNAPAVQQLQLNGEVVDIRPYTIDGRANFRLSR